MSILPFLLALIAGTLNGSYLLFLKSSQNKSLSWIVFGLITFLIAPLIVLSISSLTANIFISDLDIIICLLVGVAFGLGMFLFSRSVDYIGIGIPFALNISLGTLSGGLFSLFIHQNYDLLKAETILAYVFFLSAIVFYSISLSIRDGSGNNLNWVKGLIFALLSALLCSTQGAAIGYYSDKIIIHSHSFLAMSMPWTLIFISCSLIFILGHFKRLRTNTNQKMQYSSSLYVGLFMSFFYISSIAIYNLANIFSQKFSEAYIWMLFMAVIIVSSTFVGYLNKEWKNKNKKSIYINLFSVGLVIISIILLGCSAL